MEWKQAIRYCGMNPKNTEAVRLCRKVKSGKRLSSGEIIKLYRIAKEISWVIGTENIVLEVKNVDKRLPLTLPDYLILYKDIYSRVVIGRRSDWLVEEVSDKVIGRFVNEGLEVFPNPYVLPEHIEAILTSPKDSPFAVN